MVSSELLLIARIGKTNNRCRKVARLPAYKRTKPSSGRSSRSYYSITPLKSFILAVGSWCLLMRLDAAQRLRRAVAVFAGLSRLLTRSCVTCFGRASAYRCMSFACVIAACWRTGSRIDSGTSPSSRISDTASAPLFASRRKHRRHRARNATRWHGALPAE